MPFLSLRYQSPHYFLKYTEYLSAGLFSGTGINFIPCLNIIKIDKMKNEKDNVISMFGDQKMSKSDDAKYADLLHDFMNSFEDISTSDWSLDDRFEIGMAAWNLGNMKILLPKKEFEALVNAGSENDPNKELLKRMIAYKAAKFEEFNRFILDYELTEDNEDDTVLTVISRSEEDFFAEMQEEEDNVVAQDELDENYIDRSAIAIKPKQVYLDWISKLYPDEELTNFSEPTVYLVDEEIEDLEAWLKKKFDVFFTRELEKWDLNKSEWPKKRSYKMFKQWFNVDISMMVYDLEKSPIIKG